MSFAQHGVELRSLSRAGLRRSGRRLLPLVIVAAILSLAIGGRVAADRGNLTGPIQFGAQFAPAIHPPSGAIIGSPGGYDGQFFYAQARDPLLLNDSTVAAMRAAGAGFRLQRVAYPALAFALAGGQAGAIPFTLLASNVVILLGLAAAGVVYTRRRGWSPLWSVAIVLSPGLILAALRDLSDPLALSSMLAGLLLWRSGRRWPAAVALVIAVLTREVMMLAVVAVAGEACVRAWRQSPRPVALRDALSQAWPVIALPSLAFAGWQAYITVRYGGPVGGAGLDLPLLNFVHEAQADLHGYLPMAIWDCLYMLLVLAASAAAWLSLRHRVTITSAAACALSVGVLVPTLGDAWSDTRLSAPLFALLLVDGLQRGRRAPVLISAAAAAMTILIPVAIPGSF
ncbi:MAG: hypothetical protein QOF83_248 [Solirubrobacteraceae bacterium]|nr:hypothetical protein [Solirubrobacteraceae bacterium]